MITNEQQKALSAVFPEDKLSVKIQSVVKDKKRAMLILYLQHTDVMDRLDDAVPTWSTQVLWEGYRDIEIKSHSNVKLEKIYYVNMRMTINGISRENVGEGNDPKGAYSDAVKRCAMLFGVGRFLYDSQQVWVDYDPIEDKYKQWAYEEYKNALNAFKPKEKHESEATKIQSPLKSGPSLKGVYYLKAGLNKDRPITTISTEDLVSYKEWIESKTDAKGFLLDDLDAIKDHLEIKSKKTPERKGIVQTGYVNPPNRWVAPDGIPPFTDDDIPF